MPIRNYRDKVLCQDHNSSIDVQIVPGDDKGRLRNTVGVLVDRKLNAEVVKDGAVRIDAEVGSSVTLPAGDARLLVVCGQTRAPAGQCALAASPE